VSVIDDLIEQSDNYEFERSTPHFNRAPNIVFNFYSTRQTKYIAL